MTKKKSQSAPDTRAKKPAPKPAKPPAKAASAKPAAKAPSKPAPKAAAPKSKPVATKAPAKPAKAPTKAPAKVAEKAPSKGGAPKAAPEDPKKKPGAKPEAKKGGAPAPAKEPVAKPVKPIKPVKPAKAPGKTAGKSDRKKSAQAPPKPPPPNLADAKAAAERLAKLAGLPRVARSDNGAATIEPKVDRLTRSPLPKKELDRFRELLLAKRIEVTGDINTMESEALTSGGSGSLSSLPQHMADQGSDEYDQSLNLGLAETKRKTLREIDGALDRIDKNEFGICEILGVAIERERLEAEPWTRYSLDGARQRDRQLLR